MFTERPNPFSKRWRAGIDWSAECTESIRILNRFRGFQELTFEMLQVQSHNILFKLLPHGVENALISILFPQH